MMPICEGCSKEFRPRRKAHSRFCSRECAFAAQKRFGKLIEGWTRKVKPAKFTAISFHNCDDCGALFARRFSRPYCSENCRSRAVNRAMVGTKPVRMCRECGKEFQSQYGDKKRTFCSDICHKKNGRRVGKLVRKARKKSAGYEPVNPIKVFDRDGWRCQICGCDTPRDLRGTVDVKAPELDHKIPLARGGAHSYANTQCACRSCNIDKSDKIAA